MPPLPRSTLAQNFCRSAPQAARILDLACLRATDGAFLGGCVTEAGGASFGGALCPQAPSGWSVSASTRPIPTVRMISPSPFCRWIGNGKLGLQPSLAVQHLGRSAPQRRPGCLIFELRPEHDRHGSGAVRPRRAGNASGGFYGRSCRSRWCGSAVSSCALAPSQSRSR